MTNKKAIIYCRVSTARQAAEELPIESQLEACEAKAADLGLDVIKVFLDEGFSAASDRRPAFQDAIAFCEVYEIGHFITWSSSRFARNKRDASFYKDRLDQIGTKIVYVSMDIDTSTTGGWMLDGFMELFDEYFSRQVSADTKRSMIRNAQAGYWNGGTPPLGYRPEPSPENPKRKKLVPVESEVQLVNQIFEMKARRNMGAREIMKKLNDVGTTNRGRRWALNTIRDLLKNYTLIGKTVFGKRPRGSGTRTMRPRDQWIIVDSHAPIIDESLFFRVQDQLENETHLPTSDTSQHLLVGFLYCESCGARMHIESGTGRGKTYYYYHCRAAKLDGSHEHYRYRADLIDDQLRTVIQNRIFSVKTLRAVAAELKTLKDEWNIETRSMVTSHETEIRELERKNKNMVDVIQQIGSAASNITELASALKENSNKIEKHRQEVRRLNRVDVNQLDLDISIHELRAVLMRMVNDEQDVSAVRGFLRSILQRAELSESRMVLTYEPASVFSGMVRKSDGWLPGPQLARTKKIVVDLPPALAKRRAG